MICERAINGFMIFVFGFKSVHVLYGACSEQQISLLSFLRHRHGLDAWKGFQVPIALLLYATRF